MRSRRIFRRAAGNSCPVFSNTMPGKTISMTNTISGNTRTILLLFIPKKWPPRKSNTYMRTLSVQVWSMMRLITFTAARVWIVRSKYWIYEQAGGLILTHTRRRRARVRRASALQTFISRSPPASVSQIPGLRPKQFPYYIYYMSEYRETHPGRDIGLRRLRRINIRVILRNHRQR